MYWPASPFINGFLERCKEEFYDKKCQTQLVPLVDDAIHTFLHGQWDLLFKTIHELSLFQFRYFDFMILDNFSKDMGLNLGDSFLEWLDKIVNDFGIHDTAKLLRRMNDLPASIGFRKNSKDLSSFKGRLEVPIK